MNDELTFVLSRHILMSVLADFLSFTYESLSNAMKGKMTVAYSLLRKPFIDELLIFERLLVDKKSFVDDFFINGNPNLYDPSNRKFDKVNTIDQAIAKLKFGEMFGDDTIYKFRYDKSFPGVNGFANQALHIVTNDPNYKTSQSELNFVFKGPGDIEKYWAHYYSLMPHLMIYTTSIVDTIVFDLIEADKKYKAMKDLKRLIALILWKNLEIDTDDNRQKVIDIVGRALANKCPECGFENNFNHADFKLFPHENILLCEKCFFNFTDSQEFVRSVENFVDQF